MKITQILKEELTWSDVQMKYSGNTILLQMIMQAGQSPMNQVDGKTDWGSAIDMGSANYQKYLSDENTKRKNSEKKNKGTDKQTKATTDKKTQGAQIGNQNARKAANSVPGLKDIDFTTIGSTAKTSYQAGKRLGNLPGDQISYNKSSLKLAASKKNPNNKL
jgi:hypothetical protein